MRKFLSNGAMIFAGLVSVPAIVTSVDAKLPKMPSIPAATFKPDPRLPLLEKFFESAKAPAKAFSHVFLSEADRNALDWRLLPSISFVESSGGKAAPNNNMFGWDCGRAEFASMTEGIRTVARHLGNADRYRNKALDEILLAYNPNPEYSRIVKSVMNRIAPVE
jgi:hypothetical protein